MLVKKAVTGLGSVDVAVATAPSIYPKQVLGQVAERKSMRFAAAGAHKGGDCEIAYAGYNADRDKPRSF